MNADAPILVTLSGSAIKVKPLTFEKAEPPIVTKPSGSIISIKKEAAKAEVCISVKDGGRLTDDNEYKVLSAAVPTALIPLGRIRHLKL